MTEDAMSLRSAPSEHEGSVTVTDEHKLVVSWNNASGKNQSIRYIHGKGRDHKVGNGGSEHVEDYHSELLQLLP